MRDRRRPALGLRTRLLVSVVVAIALVLGGLTAGFNAVLAGRLDRDATDALRARAAAQLTALRVVDGHLEAPEAPDEAALDTRTWVFSGGTALEHPQTRSADDRAAALLAGGPRRVRDVAGSDTRMYAVPVVRDGHRLGTLVVGISLAPYERSARIALVASIVLAVAVLAAVALAARWVIAGALRPVARMTSQAAEWSDRDLDRRFELGEPRDDLTRLAATLDGLLERLAASFARERRFSAEVSHELRTPLASVAAEAQLALRHDRTDAEQRAAFESILDATRRMSRTLETLLTAAHAELGAQRSTSDAAGCARAAARACASLAAERGIAVTVADPPAPLRAAVEADVIERILAPLVENGCRYGSAAVRIALGSEDGAIVYRVEDDGPGVAPQEREQIFEPGRRGTAAGARAANGGGAGLGLALARRLAHAAGGEIEVEPSREGGRFVVRIPAAWLLDPPHEGRRRPR